jgi:glycosyltransferase involved in cell wall biosynthesis
MMVKDGGQLFADSLQSVQGFDAQICVLIDDRTEDNTAEIAESFGAEIQYHTWPDDFAEARNRSLEPANRKWTLVLDHDERFEAGDIPMMIGILETEDQYEAIRITTLNETSQGVTAQFIPRFIRTGSGRYKGAKHHALIITGNDRFAPARLYHKGYNLSPAKMKAKHERDISLLRKQIEDEPHETYHRRNLIRSLRGKGDAEGLLQEAAELDRLVQTHQIPVTDLSMQLVMLDTGWAHLNNSDLMNARKVWHQLADEFPANPDAWYFLGIVLYMQEKYAVAAESLSRYIQTLLALRQSLNPPNTIIESWSMMGGAYKLMAECYTQTEEWEKSLNYFQIAYMQSAQDFVGQYSSNILRIIRRKEAQFPRVVKKQQPRLILPGDGRGKEVAK